MERINNSLGISGVIIEEPKTVRPLGWFYILLLLLSFLFVIVSLWILILEGTDTSLPSFLRLPVV